MAGVNTQRCTIHLVRHGEVYNPERILYGRLPGYHLSDRGVAMAARTADYLCHEIGPTTYLAASPLTRAQETAAPLSAALNLAIRTQPLLLEAGNSFQGTQSRLGEFLKPKNWPLIYNPLRPSWGESYRSQAARMVRAIEAARTAVVEAGGEGAHGILVSHQLPIWVARLHFEGRRFFHDPRRRECGLASVTSLRFGAADRPEVSYVEPAADV